MRLSKLDELDALIAGILYIDTISRTECYYYAPSSLTDPQPEPTEPEGPVNINIHGFWKTRDASKKITYMFPLNKGYLLTGCIYIVYLSVSLNLVCLYPIPLLRCIS